MADQSDIDMDNTRAIEELTRAVQELSASLGLKTNKTETPYFIGDMTILVSYAGEWNAEKTYKVGDVVSLEEDWYKCIQGNTGERPPSGKWASYAITDGQKRLLGLFAGSNNLDIEPSGLLDNTELDKSIVKVTKSGAVGIFGNDGKPSNTFATNLLGKDVAINFAHYAKADISAVEGTHTLLDRAINRIAVSGNIIIVMPSAPQGMTGSRDFALYLKASAASAQITLDTDANTYLGDEMPTTAVGGRYIVTFTELDAEDGKTVWLRRVADITPKASA